jgi:diguanylate cyclase (GGDEF)-like protein
MPRNRQFQREFGDVVARSRRGMANGGVLLMLDLDGFGPINKRIGKDVGDEVLVEIGERLRAIVRTTDLVGRLGGDELAMFYRGEIDEAGARRLAQRVEQTIRAPIPTTAGIVRVGVSIGGLIVRPVPDIPSSTTLMHWADREMQAQKRAQKDGRATSGIRFHRYGRVPPPVDPPKDPARRGWWRRD